MFFLHIDDVVQIFDTLENAQQFMIYILENFWLYNKLSVNSY